MNYLSSIIFAFFFLIFIVENSYNSIHSDELLEIQAEQPKLQPIIKLFHDMIDNMNSSDHLIPFLTSPETLLEASSSFLKIFTSPNTILGIVYSDEEWELTTSINSQSDNIENQQCAIIGYEKTRIIVIALTSAHQLKQKSANSLEIVHCGILREKRKKRLKDHENSKHSKSKKKHSSPTPTTTMIINHSSSSSSSKPLLQTTTQPTQVVVDQGNNSSSKRTYTVAGPQQSPIIQIVPKSLTVIDEHHSKTIVSTIMSTSMTKLSKSSAKKSAMNKWIILIFIAHVFGLLF